MTGPLYRLEIMDKDGTMYTFLGGRPLKEVYEDWLENGGMAGGRIEVQGLFTRGAIDRSIVKVMMLEHINPNR